ncbi:MAG: hypothetical protein IIB58_04330 [Planctomycetes bacterium]|nr:hypothetical protein [Planctomycetota bacterium]
MRSFLEWLLSLDRLDLHEARRVSLQWLDPFEAWVWFILILVVPTYVILIYRHESGTVRSRVLMAGGRALLILFTLMLLCSPALVDRRDRTEPSTVAILIDQSASMARADRYNSDEWRQLVGLVPPVQPSKGWQRRKLLEAILATPQSSALHQATSFGLQASGDTLELLPLKPEARSPEPLLSPQSSLLGNLLTKHELRIFRFAGSLSDQQDIVEIDEAAAVAEQILAEEPSGQETDIAGALEQVFSACIDTHLAGIVLITDGQPTRQTDWSKVASLSRAHGASVYVVPLGSPRPPVDLAVHDVKSDRHVYVGDRAAIDCTVHETGLPEGSVFEIMLRDAVSNELFASRTLRAQGGARTAGSIRTQRVELQFTPRSVGQQNLVVEIPALAEELETTNNIQRLQITVIDDKIRVLYVDGYPRYEYRYLKNTLLLEESIISSTLLLSADRDFPQEGDRPIRRFPRDQEELNEYDVIVFGDVDPREGWISRTQMEMIVEFVNRHGGGFGLIAGEWYGPQRFSGTPIERLIPVDVSQRKADDLLVFARTGFRPELTAAGRESPIMRLLLDQRQAEQAFQHLPTWYWFHSATQARPGTEVLLQHPTLTHEQDALAVPLPLVVVGRYGAGRTFYQGSDDSWRWRRHKGEGFFDTYWIQVMRYLGRNKKLRPGTEISLRTDRRKVDPRSPVVVSLEFEAAAPMAAPAAELPDQVAILMRSATGIKIRDVLLTRLTANSRRFQGSFVSETAGQFELIFDPEQYAIDAPRVSTLIDVRQVSLESRRPEANLRLMSELAELTGGSVVHPGDAASVHELIPDRQYVMPDDITETIWDSKLALLIFVLLITTEWTLRKLNGLT